MEDVHISTVRAMLAKKEPVTVSYVTKDGRLETIHNAVPLGVQFYSGTRNFKLANGDIRKVRDNLIVAVNSLQVFI